MIWNGLVWFGLDAFRLTFALDLRNLDYGNVHDYLLENGKFVYAKVYVFCIK